MCDSSKFIGWKVLQKTVPSNLKKSLWTFLFHTFWNCLTKKQFKRSKEMTYLPKKSLVSRNQPILKTCTRFVSLNVLGCNLNVKCEMKMNKCKKINAYFGDFSEMQRTFFYKIWINKFSKNYKIDCPKFFVLF